jgi:hypothetical protein
MIFLQREDKKHLMKHIDALLQAAQELEIPISELSKSEAENHIHSVIKKYCPVKTTGHLSLGHNSVSLSIDKYEFLYSEILPSEPAYIFFEQDGRNKNSVAIINDAKQLCRVMENTYGMEYFVTNKHADYLIAVNWYVVEVGGSAIEWLEKIK